MKTKSFLKGKKLFVVPFFVLCFGLLSIFLWQVVQAQFNESQPGEIDNPLGGQYDLQSLQAKVGEGLNYSLDRTTGVLNFITAGGKGLPLSESKDNPRAVASQFMKEYSNYFGVRDSAKQLLVVKENKDELGMTHVRYGQKYNDIPVFGGEMIVHVKNDLTVSSANGRIVPNIFLNTTDNLISRDEAVAKAKEYWKTQRRHDNPQIIKTNRYIFNKGLVENKKDKTNYLVWQVDVYQEKPSEHEYYYINAKDGSLTYQITGKQTAVDRRIWDCSLGVLSGDCYLDFYFWFYDYTFGRSEGQPARGTNSIPGIGGTDTDDLYTYLGSIHDYYQNKFSRNGANNEGGMGDGSALFPTASTSGLTYIDFHFLDENDYLSCPNAFFNSANSIHFCAGYTSTDITAHEYAHAVDYFSILDGSGNPAGLTYSGESGALNENNSDVFGEAFEYYYEGSNNWEIGEDLAGGASRSMQDPTKYTYNLGGGDTPYPDRFYASGFYCGSEDGGGVHINSSVPNHAAYLMAMGGTFNGCTINGIGRDKEERIFYRAGTSYYTQSTDFNTAYNNLVTSCNDLYGSGSSECAEVTKALQVVEMNQGGRCGTGTAIVPACSDASGPSMANQNPANGATSVTKDSNIYFEVDDNLTGVSSSSLSVTVNSASAISSGALQSGYSGSVTSDGSGGYNVTINPDSDFSYSQSIGISATSADNNGNSTTSAWSFTTEEEPPAEGDTSSSGGVLDERDGTLVDINPKILTTSGPGQATRLQAYARNHTDAGEPLFPSPITGLYPSSYKGGAGIVPIDQNGNGVLDQFLLFAIYNGGPQALIKGLKSDGSLSSLGQMFVFSSSIRDGLSATVLDAEGDGKKNDAAFCLTGDRKPTVRVYTNISGIDDWNLYKEFTANFGAFGCNLGTFQYDDGAEELLVTPNHGPAEPRVYIYTVGGTLKKQFSAYPKGVQSGLTPSGIGDRIYTTPNNGSSQINAFDKNGDRKNFWWAYQKHVRGDFKNVPGDIDLDGKDELLISPIGQNGPQVLAFEPTGKWRTFPNFFAFEDKTLRNGVGIAVIENWHGVN